jgi:hypothetical protein
VCEKDVIVYTFSVAESFYDVTFELPNRCRGRTTYGADFTIPLIVVGTMADLRPYEHERKLISDREVTGDHEEDEDHEEGEDRDE